MLLFNGMNNTKIKFGVVVLIIIIGGGIFIIFNSSNAYPTPPLTITPDTIPTPQEKTYSMTEVASHKDANSCWTTINGNVYDVTSWIDQHPGGSQAILSLCGIDGSAAFNGQHGGQRRPEAELQSFIIGQLQ